MAQPTLSSRPATWAGTSGPILYKFTSTNYSNAGYRLEVEIWDATAAAKIADAKYYANSTGALTVDVSAFLKSSMSLDNDADLTSGTVYVDGNWIKYYIKYQEVWTASSESQVNDSGNPRWAIYGGLQIGVINDFTDYVDTVLDFLQIKETGTTIYNQKSLISFICSTSNSFFVTNHWSKENGTEVQTLLAPSSWSDDSNNPTLVFDGKSATTFTETVALTGEVGIAYQELKVNSGTTIEISIQNVMSGPGTTQGFIITLYLCDENGAVLASDSHSGSGLGTTTDTLSLTPTADAYYLYIKAQITDGASAVTFISPTTIGTDITTFTYNYVLDSTDEVAITATEKANLAQIIPDSTDDQVTVKLVRNVASVPRTLLSEVVTYNIIEDCQNIVMLAWRNSLGGWECYPFTYNQEYTWHYSDRKAKRLTLFADNLTLAQWEAIQGLNTLGDLYQTPINEMTTSLNRTSATIGQSVYVLNSDGTKTGVNVIGQANTTATKQKTHSAVVTIEYPELFLQ